ncbi:MAG: class I SAM-dependent methyltransferase [Desulfobacteraceae bacterium]|jgi:cyclopropane fatty-acyl-phospholipid synthase-like methyltransferase|nr:class I SAM-dependent methyltransferase [Desulfobacteraceae bacterium]
MRCMICRNPMEFYFSKRFDFIHLTNVDYVKCVNCGFVLSKTHYELSDESWGAVNKKYHQSYQGTNHLADDPMWLERLDKQVEVIADTVKIGLISQTNPHLDFGCGDGKLSDMITDRHGVKIDKFDRYNQGKGYLTDEKLKKNKFDFVVTTSVFEHLLKREMLDEINNLVSDTGVMGLHTLVAEEVPDNSDWFYLVPVHCAFYTNKSMQILFDEWGYTSSVYQLDSQLWLFFKADADKIEQIIKNTNSQPNRKFYYHFKRGFMDYWKLNKDEINARQKQPL